MEEVTYKNREEMVYQVLKEEILNLELKPGQVIKENEICERFSVSRTPVRDALRLFAGDRDLLGDSALPGNLCDAFRA